MKTVYLVKSAYNIVAAFEEEPAAEEFASQHSGIVEYYCVFKDMDEMRKVHAQIENALLIHKR